MWTEMARTWEADAEKPNLFASTVHYNDLTQVRLRMAKIAADDFDHLQVWGDMHETEMLSMELQLEESQRTLATVFKNVGQHETPTQGRARIKWETKLRRKIDGWITVQQLFIPEAALLRQREAVLALNEMRSHLISRTREYKHQGKVTGVRAKMRSGTRVAHIQAEVDRAADEYRAALVALGPCLQRRDYAHLQALNTADVRSRPSTVFGDDDRRKKGGKRKKKARRMAAVDPEAAAEEAEVAKQKAEDGMEMSWIWKVEGATGEDQDVGQNEALRIEWAKARAKAMCYTEETDLLEEEMRRVLQFFQWRADWWRARVGSRAARQDKALREGHGSYALKQAACQDGMRAGFENQWRGPAGLVADARAACAKVKADVEGEESDEEADERGGAYGPV
ncbi:hypothetical protein B0H14DRAFT_2655745 [Mycena olivaceomarginata]|nr:hypothetical protein B0H14DRAFT_2655745 [Mycena olivaceomarginata]